MHKARRLILALALASCPLLAHSAYPDRPLRLVMPFAAGGASDAVARIVAPELSARLGQPVIIENHPGAQGALAGQFVAGAPADGYTLLYAVSATAALPLVTRTSYDMARDFAPVSTLGAFEFAMFVSSTVPATSVPEFIAYAKKNAGKANYATLNLGEDFAAAAFMQAAGVGMTRIPFTSGAQILSSMTSNDVQVNFGPLANSRVFTKGGRARALATLGSERSAQAPEVPTMKEAGLPDVAFDSIQMLFVRANTPAEIVERLSREINAVVSTAEARGRLEKLALKPKGSTPEELRKAQAAADAAWARLAQKYRLGAE